MPAAVSASTYGDGPPASQPLTCAPARRASRTPADAPAPAAPMTWIRSPRRIARASRAGARPFPISAARRVKSFQHERQRRMCAAQLVAVAMVGPDEAAHVMAVLVRDAHVRQSNWFGVA